MTIAEEELACRCDACECGNDADVITRAGVPMCGCCLADCPDVHGPDGRTWYAGQFVRMVPWSGGWKLHVDGIGVTQCSDKSQAEETVRDYLETEGHKDARTIRLTWLRDLDIDERS